MIESKREQPCSAELILGPDGPIMGPDGPMSLSELCSPEVSPWKAMEGQSERTAQHQPSAAPERLQNTEGKQRSISEPEIAAIHSNGVLLRDSWRNTEVRSSMLEEHAAHQSERSVAARGSGEVGTAIAVHDVQQRPLSQDKWLRQKQLQKEYQAAKRKEERVAATAAGASLAAAAAAAATQQSVHDSEAAEKVELQRLLESQAAEKAEKAEEKTDVQRLLEDVRRFLAAEKKTEEAGEV